ncbi:MAG: penicillin-binding protein activator [Rhodospirillales bacterium]|nr:MAG: penicillin-binding protein activator [Rhodospirillales bacterium]
MFRSLSLRSGGPVPGCLAMATLGLLLAACAAPIKPISPAPPSPAMARTKTPGEAEARPEAVPRPTPSGKVKIALLLPLTGRGRDVGTAMLEAAELAIFDGAGRDVAIMPIDAGDTPERAIAAVERAAREGASILLGPLFGPAAAAAAQAAREVKLEMVSFSNDEGVAQPGLYPMGLAMRPQVTRVAEYALSRGIKRFAAFSPSTPYGDQATRALRDAVASRGGTVVAAERLPAAGGDVSAGARRIGAALNDGAGGATAVFLPVAGASLASAGQALRDAGLDPAKARLLGTGVWDTPTIAAEGAIPGAWFAAPDPARRADFERRFAAVHGKPPHRLATLSYDAVMMSARLARLKPGGDFSAAALTDPAGFQGLDGLYRFRPDGRVERALAVLEIGADRVRVVDPAPTSLDRPSN